jgi:uncharacterized protein
VASQVQWKSDMWWIDLAFGMALGIFLVLAIFAVQWLMGWIEITGTFLTDEPGLRFGPAILALWLTWLVAALQEEMTYRGFLRQNIAEGLNFKRVGPQWATQLALLVSSIFFGLLHAGQQNATSFSVLNTIAVSVLVIAPAYVLTGELALPLGFHATWNNMKASLNLYGTRGGAEFGAAFLSIQ